ncbi:MAG: hypothetical protein PHC55_07960 [Bacteroidales bacterium]|nr:hypothetical protein [Bacteroidales bacterium]
MRHFIQHHFRSNMLKAVVGFLLLFVGLQPGYGQCVQCDSTTTTGWFSSAVGRYSKATGHYAFAGGILSEANGMASLAFGNRVRADGTGSFAIGMFVRAWGTASGVLGTGFSLDDPLVNTQSYSLMVGFGSTKPTFFVGPSNGVNSTGKIGIGNVTDPQAKLHIRADQYEDASILLEASASNKKSSFLMSGIKAVFGTSQENQSLSFVTGTTNTRMFINAETGNIGIGSEDPKAKLQVKDGDIFIEDINRGIIMKSPDGRCWRGVLNNSGQLEFTEIPDCVISSTNAQTFQPDLGVTISPNPVSNRLEVECRLIGAEARLMNLSGIEISSHPLQQGASFIPVHDLKPGMYLLNVFMQGKGVVETHKFVKQ